MSYFLTSYEDFKNLDKISKSVPISYLYTTNIMYSDL